jgi:lipid-A-disaccharide synthase
MTARPPLRICLVAGEVSGDRLGAALMRALRTRTGDAVIFSGVGGREMAAEGLKSPFPIGDLAVIGFLSIPARLKTILRRIKEAADVVIAARPDVLVVIDSPEFTHRVAKRIRSRAPQIPIVDYVSPSVWAWRPWRARTMRRYIDRVLALLPFEPDIHARLGGPPCVFVGHPVADRVGELRPDVVESQRRAEDPPVLLVMPGSRGGELARMLPIFGATAKAVRDRFGPLEIIVPAVPHLADRVQKAVSAWTVPARVVTDITEKNAAFRTARAALAKSGTGTLELAVAGVPMIAAYKVPWIEEIVARVLVQVPSFILANLVIGERVVPEFVQRDCTPEHLAASLLPLLRDSAERQAQLTAFSRLDAIMEIGTASPAERAADAVLDMVERCDRPRKSSVALTPSAS